MKKIYLIFWFTGVLVFALGSISLAQTACDGVRYIENSFTSTTKATVKYGENTTIGGSEKDLLVDVYEPEGDATAMRPLVILAFGGSFIAGSRGDLQDECEYYARKGYVAASIDYRLFDIIAFPDSLGMMDVVVKAVADMKAAVRFFRKDAATSNQFRIDPNNIFVGGQSAGAIAAAHAAYVTDLNEAPDYLATSMTNNGGIEGDTDDPTDSALGYSSEVQGVINLFGALHRKEFIEADDPPIISIHGTDDNIVPYGFGYATVFSVPIVSMEGSRSMSNQADSVGICNHMITVPGAGHGTFLGDPFWADSIYYTSAQFMESIVCENNFCSPLTTVNQLDVSRQVVAFPNPSAGGMTIAFNGLNETYEAFVTDNAGRLIQHYANQNTDRLALASKDFSPGFYHLYIRFNDATIAPVVKKLVFVE